MTSITISKEHGYAAAVLLGFWVQQVKASLTLDVVARAPGVEFYRKEKFQRSSNELTSLRSCRMAQGRHSEQLKRPKRLAYPRVFSISGHSVGTVRKFRKRSYFRCACLQCILSWEAAWVSGSAARPFVIAGHSKAISSDSRSPEPLASPNERAVK
jgi:hypothetical protein